MSSGKNDFISPNFNSQWEYLFVIVDDSGNYGSGWTEVRNEPGVYSEQTWSSVNGLGEIGWELVSINWERDSEATGVFKRRTVYGPPQADMSGVYSEMRKLIADNRDSESEADNA